MARRKHTTQMSILVMPKDKEYFEDLKERNNKRVWQIFEDLVLAHKEKLSLEANREGRDRLNQ